MSGKDSNISNCRSSKFNAFSVVDAIFTVEETDVCVMCKCESILSLYVYCQLFILVIWFQLLVSLFEDMSENDEHHLQMICCVVRDVCMKPNMTFMHEEGEEEDWLRFIWFDRFLVVFISVSSVLFVCLFGYVCLCVYVYIFNAHSIRFPHHKMGIIFVYFVQFQTAFITLQIKIVYSKFGRWKLENGVYIRTFHITSYEYTPSILKKSSESQTNAAKCINSEEFFDDIKSFSINYFYSNRKQTHHHNQNHALSSVKSQGTDTNCLRKTVIDFGNVAWIYGFFPIFFFIW